MHHKKKKNGFVLGAVKKMSMKKLVLFDFDGVLVDSFELAYEISQSFVDVNISREEYRAFFNGNVYDSAPSHDKKEERLQADDPWFVPYKAGLMKLEPVEGIAETLAALHQDGYILSVVSSSLNAPILDYVKKHGLDHYFDDILGADVHKSKVVKIQQTLAKHQATASDAVFITDTLGDMREAEKAAVESIGVSWGFHDIEHLSRGNPLNIVRHPSDLIQAIKQAFS